MWSGEVVEEIYRIREEQRIASDRLGLSVVG